MPLDAPLIDQRDYQQIVSEALARIPSHTPEWTNFDDSDPGVTLLQLFAFMTESIIYRTNLIPARVQRKFLKLLDIPMQAATAATGFVTFDATKVPLQDMVLPASTELSAGKIAFRTLYGLEALPIEARVYYKKTVSEARRAEVDQLFSELYASYTEDQDTEFEYYETTAFEQPQQGAELPLIDLATVQGNALWLALFASKAADVEHVSKFIAGRYLTLGILPAVDQVGKHLTSASTAASQSPPLIFDVPYTALDLDTIGIFDYRLIEYYHHLNPRPYADVIQEPGLVEITLPDYDVLASWREIASRLDPLEQGVGTLPPSIDDTELGDRLITWIRVRVGSDPANERSKLNLRLHWIGINASLVEQRVDVSSEDLGRGTGQPDQVVRLVNTPVLPERVRLFVNAEEWQPIDDILTAPPEIPVADPRLLPGTSTGAASLQDAKVYQLDAESGEIRFGSGLNGARPPRGAVIRAQYSYGGGRQGNVGIDAIKKGANLPAGVKVTNPLRTWGGSDAETVDQAEKRMAQVIRHRDRLVSTKDFKDVACSTPGVDLGRVEILPLVHPDLPSVQSPGVVTVMVIPKYDPLSPKYPSPDQLFLETICTYLDSRRLVTTEIFVRGPAYKDIWVSIGFDAVAGVATAQVRENIKATIEYFLSPLQGGYDQQGWMLGKGVDALEIGAVAARVPGVAKVYPVLIIDDEFNMTSPILMTNLTLPRLKAVVVQVGPPASLAEVLGTGVGGSDSGGIDDGTGTRDSHVVPVPVIPPECE